jgi:hypothetical protein
MASIYHPRQAESERDFGVFLIGSSQYMNFTIDGAHMLVWPGAHKFLITSTSRGAAERVVAAYGHRVPRNSTSRKQKRGPPTCQMVEVSRRARCSRPSSARWRRFACCRWPDADARAPLNRVLYSRYASQPRPALRNSQPARPRSERFEGSTGLLGTGWLKIAPNPSYTAPGVGENIADLGMLDYSKWPSSGILR